MTQRNVLIAIIIFIIFVTGITFSIWQRPSENEQQISGMLTPKQLKQTIQSKEETFVYYYQPNCIYCELLKSTIDSTAKAQNVQFVSLDLAKYDLWDKYHIEYTPTIVRYQDGQEVNRFDSLEGIFYEENDELYLDKRAAEEALLEWFKK
ncbi:MAG: thioredoxin family protein [Bacillaceae bacterium]